MAGRNRRAGELPGRVAIVSAMLRRPWVSSVGGNSHPRPAIWRAADRLDLMRAGVWALRPADGRRMGPGAGPDRGIRVLHRPVWSDTRHARGAIYLPRCADRAAGWHPASRS